MDGFLADANIATRKGSTAVEFSLRFELPTVNVCSSDFLDDLADLIVASVGRTDKRLLRLYCSESTVKVQVLNTIVPVKKLRSSDDVALELLRQLSYPESPFLLNVTGVDPSFRPRPIQVTNCSDTSLVFEPRCAESAPVQTSWLGLEPNSNTTILIFVAVGVLLCSLFAVCALCVRRCWQDRKKVDEKAKWIVAVQKEQARELAKCYPARDCNSETSSRLLPINIPIPVLLPSTHTTASPSPRSVPHNVQSPNTTFYQEYEEVEADIDMDTPPSGDAYDANNVFVLEGCDGQIIALEEETTDCLNDRTLLFYHD